jgi:TPR repeat protein
MSSRYHKAADAGYVLAIRELGRMNHEGGLGLDKDEAKATAW